ncbi:hypothetical protein CsatA_006977 [Cannabis sativa]
MGDLIEIMASTTVRMVRPHCPTITVFLINCIKILQTVQDFCNFYQFHIQSSFKILQTVQDFSNFYQFQIQSR